MPIKESSTIFGEHNDSSDRQMADILQWVVREYGQYFNTENVALLNHNQPRYWLLLRGFEYGYEEFKLKKIVGEYGPDGLTLMDNADGNSRGICLFGTNLVRNDVEKVMGAMSDDRVDCVVLADDERNLLGTGSVPWDEIINHVPSDWVAFVDGDFTNMIRALGFGKEDVFLKEGDMRAMVFVRRNALE